jgi:RNA polymerase sigma-70 factor (ECF subfamily)
MKSNMIRTNYLDASFAALERSAEKSVDEVRAAHAGDDDAKLIAAFIKGDGESFAALVDRHMPMVYKFTYRYVGDVDVANDVVQDVFIKVWKNIKKFDPKKNFKTWLLTITKNTALDSIKKKKAMLFSKIEEGETDLDSFLSPYVESPDLPDALLERKQTKADLDRMLQELSPTYRSVLLLRYTEHLKFREIADALQEPIDTIKSKHRRALIQLRKMLAEEPKPAVESYNGGN